MRLLPGDTRYLPVSLENTLVSVEADGRSAEVSGRVRLTGTGTANTLWVLASAFDSAGNVVGVRRWESAAALNASAPGRFRFSGIQRRAGNCAGGIPGRGPAIR